MYTRTFSSFNSIANSSYLLLGYAAKMEERETPEMNNNYNNINSNLSNKSLKETEIDSDSIPISTDMDIDKDKDTTVSPISPVTTEELDITIRVLKILSKSENKIIYDSQPYRPLRQVLQPFFDKQKSSMFSGLNPGEHSAKQFNKRRMAQDKYNKILEDEKNLKRTMLRAGRLKRLEEIGE